MENFSEENYLYCQKSGRGGRRLNAGRKRSCLKKIPYNRRINENVLNILREYAKFHNISETEALESAILMQSKIDKLKGDKVMKIAIPTEDNHLCSHFGHCEAFTFVEVNPETKEIIESNMKIEIFEPESIECEDGEEYCTTVSKEYGGPECNGSGMTSNTGLVWYETRVEDEEETKIIITHYEDIQWGYKMVITVGNPNNYKVTNIINWLLNSISITNY